uniref:Uncharacterized protein n=1 Tax=Manihot esculenta TaxID=3983 RepID=A0A2C9V225_MANES
MAHPHHVIIHRILKLLSSAPWFDCPFQNYQLQLYHNLYPLLL